MLWSDNTLQFWCPWLSSSILFLSCFGWNVWVHVCVYSCTLTHTCEYACICMHVCYIQFMLQVLVYRTSGGQSACLEEKYAHKYHMERAGSGRWSRQPHLKNWDRRNLWLENWKKKVSAFILETHIQLFMENIFRKYLLTEPFSLTKPYCFSKWKRKKEKKQKSKKNA